MALEGPHRSPCSCAPQPSGAVTGGGHDVAVVRRKSRAPKPISTAAQNHLALACVDTPDPSKTVLASRDDMGPTRGIHCGVYVTVVPVEYIEAPSAFRRPQPRSLVVRAAHDGQSIRGEIRHVHLLRVVREDDQTLPSLRRPHSTCPVVGRCEQRLRVRRKLDRENEAGVADKVKRHSPASPHQILAVLSVEAVATNWPSGENEMPMTWSVWPSKVRRHSPLSAHHTFAVLSVDAVAKTREPHLMTSNMAPLVRPDFEIGVDPARIRSSWSILTGPATPLAMAMACRKFAKVPSRGACTPANDVPLSANRAER
eukprot:CAMPEP_0170360140 /NCGR_PEP_ID=MMETSP0117_2-20130122/3124_1 /TAXON_ID=400756 /ORGANISM="Durinskia baltica, Strain CSIRO CS-38" /LENGTH=312 /DNA_ID=CAMNT_0010614439 /DNA_START=425 /DNA_END=1364 /DNA_ORIENTATION=-